MAYTAPATSSEVNVSLIKFVIAPRFGYKTTIAVLNDFLYLFDNELPSAQLSAVELLAASCESLQSSKDHGNRSAMVLDCMLSLNQIRRVGGTPTYLLNNVIVHRRLLELLPPSELLDIYVVGSFYVVNRT